MKLQRVAVGHWLLGSTIQLKEVYEAMRYARSLHIREEDLKRSMKRLSPKEVEYHTESINTITSRIGKHGEGFVMTEDGLVIVTKDTTDEEVEDVVRYLSAVLDKYTIPFLHELFSRSVPIPEVLENQQHSYPVVLHFSSATEEEVFTLCASLGEIVYKTVKTSSGFIIISSRLAVVVGNKLSKRLLQDTILYLMFARAYELEIRSLFVAQRSIWNELERIRKHEHQDQTELSKIRDRAQRLQNESNYLSSKVQQMVQFLDWRTELVDSYLTDKKMAELFHSFFHSLETTQMFLRELWEMTSTSANATVQSLSLLYSDNQAREIQTLQKLFLITAVISIVSLGTFAGSNMITRSADGTLVSIAQIHAWNMSSFAVYGVVAFLGAFIVYGIFALIIKFSNKKHSA